MDNSRRDSRRIYDYYNNEYYVPLGGLERRWVGGEGGSQLPWIDRSQRNCVILKLLVYPTSMSSFPLSSAHWFRTIDRTILNYFLLFSLFQVRNRALENVHTSNSANSEREITRGTETVWRLFKYVCAITVYIREKKGKSIAYNCVAAAKEKIGRFATVSHYNARA